MLLVLIFARKYLTYLFRRRSSSLSHLFHPPILFHPYILSFFRTSDIQHVQHQHLCSIPPYRENHELQRSCVQSPSLSRNIDQWHHYSGYNLSNSRLLFDCMGGRRCNVCNCNSQDPYMVPLHKRWDAMFRGCTRKCNLVLKSVQSGRNNYTEKKDRKENNSLQ